MDVPFVCEQELEGMDDIEVNAKSVNGRALSPNHRVQFHLPGAQSSMPGLAPDLRLQLR